MKKIFAVLSVLLLVFVVSGCAKKVNDGNGLVQTADVVKSAVKGWVVYTNPAYRYEIRFPQEWTFKDSGEDGKLADFMPKGETVSKLTIKSYSNWSQKFNLEQFYEDRKEDFFKTMKKEDIDLGGTTGKLIRGLTGRVEGSPEKLVDLVVLDMGDRIIEIELRDSNETVKIIMSSIKFYGNVTNTDAK
jgi:hypothetical protein